MKSRLCYPTADPLDAAARRLLFIHRPNGRWLLLRPISPQKIRRPLAHDTVVHVLRNTAEGREAIKAVEASAISQRHYEITIGRLLGVDDRGLLIRALAGLRPGRRSYLVTADKLGIPPQECVFADNTAANLPAASTPAVDRDLVAEAPRTVGRAGEIDLRQRGRPSLLRLPESADGGNP
jgi:hypothetical protein